MSTVIERVGSYAAALKWEDLPGEVAGYAKRILLDSLACAYGGFDSEPARLVRETLDELSETRQATVFGGKVKIGVSAAALANGVAIRYQDYNDVYFGPAWTAHPSDVLFSRSSRISIRVPASRRSVANARASPLVTGLR